MKDTNIKNIHLTIPFESSLDAARIARSEGKMLKEWYTEQILEGISRKK
jgi:hypothetical protein